MTTDESGILASDEAGHRMAFGGRIGMASADSDRGGRLDRIGALVAQGLCARPDA